MEINFETKALRDACEDEALAAQTLGSAAAEALQHRLADIRAADTIHEVLAGRPQAGGSMDCYRFELADSFYLVVRPNHMKPRKNAAGMTDWDRVRRVLISLDPRRCT